MIWEALLKYVELDSEHRNALIDIVMKFSSNTHAFLLLRLDQLPADACESLFCTFALGNIGED